VADATRCCGTGTPDSRSRWAEASLGSNWGKSLKEKNSSQELEFDTWIKVPVNFLHIKLSGTMRAAAPRVTAERCTVQLCLRQIAEALVSIF
jgi:hypothetical protein